MSRKHKKHLPNIEWTSTVCTSGAGREHMTLNVKIIDCMACQAFIAIRDRKVNRRNHCRSPFGTALCGGQGKHMPVGGFLASPQRCAPCWYILHGCQDPPKRIQRWLQNSSHQPALSTAQMQ